MIKPLLSEEINHCSFQLLGINLNLQEMLYTLCYLRN